MRCITLASPCHASPCYLSLCVCVHVCVCTCVWPQAGVQRLHELFKRVRCKHTGGRRVVLLEGPGLDKQLSVLNATGFANEQTLIKVRGPS